MFMQYYNICCHAASVTVLGQEFRGGDVVCLQAPSDVSFPTFGQIIWNPVSEELKILVENRGIFESL